MLDPDERHELLVSLLMLALLVGVVYTAAVITMAIAWR